MSYTALPDNHRKFARPQPASINNPVSYRWSETADYPVFGALITGINRVCQGNGREARMVAVHPELHPALQAPFSWVMSARRTRLRRRPTRLNHMEQQSALNADFHSGLVDDLMNPFRIRLSGWLRQDGRDPHIVHLLRWRFRL